MAIERIVPGTIEWDAFYANHIFRYQKALDYLKQNNCNKVLDAATGVGYGAYFLASNGIKKIIAVDKSEEALKIAVKDYTHLNINFINDDCHTLYDVKNFAPFDAVVSFETLEHLRHPQAFLKTINDYLKPNGILIISTPNNINSEDANKRWEFHEKEYSVKELYKILEENNFIDIEITGQALSPIAILKQELRGELNRIYSNPFNRLGRFMQMILKGHKKVAVLPEKLNDFVIVTKDNIENKNAFVLIATARKL